jgi:hypothetical protein
MFPNSGGIDPVRLLLCKYLSSAKERTGESASWKLNMRDAYCENVMYYNSTRGTIQALTMQATHSLSV